MIAVIPCGGSKLRYAARAVNLYTGTYFRANRAYALSLVPINRLFILSARHGLIPSDRWLEPYEQTFNRPGHVERSRLREQVRELGLKQEEAIILGGRLYHDAIRGLFARERFVVDQIIPRLPGAGIGYQIQWLKAHRGQLP
ncbi:DUF6884 domain-containing protein [Paraburkholderia sp. EG304]|uniref:DUF6884 domain-containing protein n=1 Tax=Paraburkholderia sp. EG304 TaxID=3237015 RepID=UPI00397BBAE8